MNIISFFVNKKNSRYLKLFIMIFILTFMSTAAFSKKKKKKRKKKNKKKIERVIEKKPEKKPEKKEEIPAEMPFSEKYELRFGLLPAFAMPMGDLGAVLGSGFGGTLFTDMKIMQLGQTAQLRGALSAGYETFSGNGTDFDGTVNLIPAEFIAEVSYPMLNGVRPYFGVGGGMSMTSVSGSSPDNTREVTEGSSMDGLFSVNLGLGYTPASLKKLEIIMNVKYLFVFETVMGQFLNLQLGAAYRLYTPGGYEASQLELNK